MKFFKEEKILSVAHRQYISIPKEAKIFAKKTV
jgi:hypothetical protein